MTRKLKSQDLDGHFVNPFVVHYLPFTNYYKLYTNHGKSC